MVRTYRLGGAERERARALICILGIDMDHVRWLDGHPMTVRVFDDGKCWVEYTGLVVCDKEDVGCWRAASTRSSRTYCATIAGCPRSTCAARANGYAT